jgi:Dullard-like phosphatase family protein
MNILHSNTLKTYLQESVKSNSEVNIIKKALLLHKFDDKARFINASKTLNHKSQHLPVLVLGLDETIIYSSTDPAHSHSDFHLSDNDSSELIHVFQRPFLKDFLQMMSAFYQIAIFTKGYSCYADPIIDHIDKHNIIYKRLCNTSLVKTEYGYEKRLHVVAADKTPKKIVLVDNSPTSCISDHDNLFLIKAFCPNKVAIDKELLNLGIFFVLSHNISDFRTILGRRDTYVDGKSNRNDS